MKCRYDIIISKYILKTNFQLIQTKVESDFISKFNLVI